MKRLFAVLMIITLLINNTGCDKKDEYNRYSYECFDVFDTFTQIAIYSDNKALADKIYSDIYSELSMYHKLYDIYNDYDEINNIKTINDNAGNSAIKVDKKIIDLLLYSKEQYKNTDGKMNVAMGSVLSIWHDYRSKGLEDTANAQLPPLEILNAANEHTNINDIIIDEQNSTVYLKDKDMSLDVGAIAKGYAVKEISDKYKNKGYQILLSVGGNVSAIGGKDKNNDYWNIGIQNPHDSSNIECTIKLKDMSLVTSGDYQRFYVVDGVSYNHIINPDTLMPAVFVSSVSVLSDDSAMCDALSTALFNMSVEDGISFVNSLDNVEAYWVDKNGKTYMTDGIKNYLS